MAITAVGEKQEFAYTGGVQEFVVPFSGLYKLEVWGGRPQSFQMYGFTQRDGGAGGYSVGYKELKKGTVLYIVCGGGNGATYNGGGATTHGDQRNGAGATHIALVSGTLAEIGYDEFVTNQKGLIVAGGGGSGSMYGSYSAEGGTGGGLTGGSATHYGTQAGGTQTSGHAFGRGGNGAGGGLYGGYGANGVASGGGSGYIEGVPVITFKGTTYEPSTQNGGNTEKNGKATITYVAKGELPITFNGIPIGSMIHNGVEVKSWIHNGVDVFSGTPKIYPLYMSSANEGGFEAFAGSVTGGYTRIEPTLVKAESLKVSFTGTLDSNAFYVGCAISKEIDLTRFTTLKFTHNSKGTDGSVETNGTFFITSTKGATMTPIVSETLFNAYNLNNQSGEKVIDISSLNGTFYIGIEVRAYDLATATVSISNMYME